MRSRSPRDSARRPAEAIGKRYLDDPRRRSLVRISPEKGRSRKLGREDRPITRVIDCDLRRPLENCHTGIMIGSQLP